LARYPLNKAGRPRSRPAHIESRVATAVIKEGHDAQHVYSISARQASFTCQFFSPIPTVDVVLIEDNVMTGDQFNWVDHTEPVANDVFGEPNNARSRPPDDVRFGQQGSVSVDYSTGRWFDHENNRGGGVRELIRIFKGIEDDAAAMLYAKECRENSQNNQNACPRGNAGANQQHQCEVEATYTYHYASGQVAFEVVRFVLKKTDGGYVTDERGKRSKKFGQRRPSGELDKTWLWGLEAGEFMRRAPGQNWFKFEAALYERYPAGKERKTFNNPAAAVLYALPDLLKALAVKQVVCIPEGEKKVESVRLLGFAATCSAGGARKWRPEHSALFAGADVVLLPDNDSAGRAHVEAIAESLIGVAWRVRVLDLPNLPEKGDVVDWVAAGGTPAEFSRLLEAAGEYRSPENSAPQPLMRALPPPEPFPLDALGLELAGVAKAIHERVQSPLEMCATAVLAAVSLATAAHLDVILPTGQVRPSTAWFWCVAGSGERKTSTDYEAFAAFKEREKRLRACRDIEMADFDVRHRIWEAQIKATEKHYKEMGSAGSVAHENELRALGPEPQEPLDPLLMSAEFTYEGMCVHLDRGQPLYGIIGSEGGQFIGGHGMSNDAKMRTAAGLSAAWDGEPIKRVRVTGTLVLPGRRVGMHLMVQPSVAGAALNDALLQDQGFLTRVLPTAPASLIGTRLHKPSKPQPALSEYTARLLAILESSPPLAKDKRNELEPRPLPFSPAAATLYWEFCDAVEHAMAPGGEYAGIRGFAAKLPEHAARLATAIAGYQDITVVELSDEEFKRGIALAVYYASEAKRLQGSTWANPKLVLAQTLLEWLQNRGKPRVTARDIYTYGPGAIRDRGTTLELVNILVAHGWLRQVKTHRQDRLEWEVVSGVET
jgi:hypothetical protein